jgi:hypothetical protein
MAMHVSGPIGIANAPAFAVSLTAMPTALAAASGMIIARWRQSLPSYATKLHEIGVVFTRGGTTPPQGGMLRFKVWSGSTAKGVFAGSVAGGTAERVTLRLSGGATFPAQADFGIAVHTAGATQAGRGAQPTLYMSYL